MATVRLTDSLRREILNSAEEAYTTQNPEPINSPELTTKIRNGILNMPIMKELSDVESKFPQTLSYYKQYNNSDAMASDFIKRVTHTTETTTVIIENGYGSRISKIDLPTSITVPVSRYTFTVDIQMFSLEEQEEITNMINEAEENEESWKKSKEEFKESIASLLAECTTTKQLLDVWPAAEKLLPEHVIVRMHEKATRKDKVERIRSQTNFDLNAANQVLLTSSLLGD